MTPYTFQFQPVRLAQTPAAPPAAPTGPKITSGQRKLAIGLGAFHTAFGAVATWVGVRAGMHEKGVYSTLGYAVAAGGGVFTLVNLLGTLGMVAKAD